MATAVAEKLTAQYRAHPQWSYQLHADNLAVVVDDAVVDDDDLVVRTLREAGFTVLHATWMSAQPTLFDAQENEGRT